MSISGGAGIQITIPDLDDGDLNSTPTPFGRTTTPFGFGSRSGADSPTATTPLAFGRSGDGDRSYFQSHSRGDSAASEDSAISLGTGRSAGTGNNAGLGFKSAFNTSQSSLGAATTSTANTSVSSGTSPFTRKSSFASLRNAFKSSSSKQQQYQEPPPVPSIYDHQQGYPVLKNPFNRSTSSLGRNNNTQPIASPPSFGRPTTPSSRYNTKKGHSAGAKSQHSQNGSIFHFSDAGSDAGGFNFGQPAVSSSPPPVPRMPPQKVFGRHVRNESSTVDEEEDKVVMDPKTPSDFALHAVFMRFATAAEHGIAEFLKHPLHSEPFLPDHLGPGLSPSLDSTLSSLGKIAQRNAKAVIDSVLRWRTSQADNVASSIIHFHMSPSPNPTNLHAQNNSPSQSFSSSSRVQVPHDVPALLNERKSLASIYIMCRALIAILQPPISKDALGEVMGNELEKRTFDQFRKPNLKLLAMSRNHRVNSELYAELLGWIAGLRFVSVTDMFLKELGPVASGQVPKDLDMKFEHLVKGLEHIKIKVWPTEAFDEGAEFMESLSVAFANAHGQRLKIAFAETLVKVLHPIGKTAQVETNDPVWRKSIEVIYPKAREMALKPRYWAHAFPLGITALCVAPQEFFLKNWMSCFEVCLAKLKEKPGRLMVMNGIMRLVWTYLYRCQESGSTTTSKLETIMKNFFPANRSAVYPASEDAIRPLACIVHFILSRHPEFGRDLCMDLIQDGSAPERLTIVSQAILLSLHLQEREELRPSWPSTTDFALPPSSEDYPINADFLPSTLASKPSIQQFFDRYGPVLAATAAAAGNAVGKMSIFDEQWAYKSTAGAQHEEASYSYVIHKHGDITVAYPGQFTPHINLLKTCFQSWPRCLHSSSLTLGDAVDLLVRCTVHVDPGLAAAAGEALGRFVKDGTVPAAVSSGSTTTILQSSSMMILTVLGRYNAFLFSPMRVARECSGPRLLIEGAPLLELWATLVEDWVNGLVEKAQSKTNNHTSEDVIDDSESSSKLALARLNEVESGALFLISHQLLFIRRTGTRILRALGVLAPHLTPDPGETPMMMTSAGELQPLRIVELLHGKGMQWSWIEEQSEALESKDLLERVEQLLVLKSPSVLLQIAESSGESDRLLWRHFYPRFLQLQSEVGAMPPSLASLRETIIAATGKYVAIITHLAGLSLRAPSGFSSRSQGADGTRLLQDHSTLVGQWYAWIKILCATAILQESRPAQSGREHSRAPSDANSNFEKEKFSTTRGLFRYLTPFLDSEYLMFRDAAVLCVCIFPSAAYPQLLEDLSLLAGRQFYDDPRSKGTRRHERLHSAVARIYYLTAPFLEQQRSLNRQTALTHVLKFVRNTQTFLSSAEIRDKHQWQLLRRYFCGTVERLFDCLANLKDTDRFISSNMHLSLYRLCEEWCQLGPQQDAVRQRLVIMQRAASAAQDEWRDKSGRFQRDTAALSDAAVGALSSLCQRAFSPPDGASGSPLERFAEQMKPLSVANVLERLYSILSSVKPQLRTKGKKALRFLLTANTEDPTLLVESLRRGAVTSEVPDSSAELFFEVLVDVVCSGEEHGFSFAQILLLGLVNLCHPLPTVRRLAFKALERIHVQTEGLLAMNQFEPGILSLAPSAYGHYHRIIADFLAGEHPDQGHDFLREVSLFLPHLSSSNVNRQVLLMALQSLEFWISNIQLMEEDVSQGLSKEGMAALAHMLSLTVRFGDQHTEQIMALWTKLVEPPNQANAIATVRFLLEQAHKVANAPYVSCAANIVASLCQTAVGRMVYEELCSVIEPDRMIPVIEHKLAFPEEDDLEVWSDLGTLFGDQPRWPPLGAAQFAWLFLAEVTLQRPWELRPQLPVLLHVLLTHVDHRIPYIRQQAQRMGLQLLRLCTAGYDDLVDRANYPNRATLQGILLSFEEETKDGFWKEDEGINGDEPKKMSWVCKQTLSFLDPLCPKLMERWGSLALLWGTSCSIRATACRSLQIFRSLASRATKSDLALLLGRLSNTIADPDPNIQRFTSEILLTLTSLASRSELDKTQLPQFFWCTCACLCTPVEEEFKQALNLLEMLLTRIDLDDPATAELLISTRPCEWNGQVSLQPLLLKGLRSSATSQLTLKIFRHLAKISDDRLIDPGSGRVRDLYTLALPWCLRVMTADSPDTNLQEFAECVARLAKKEGRESISKIMNSLSKSAFRTKEDFLRQSVSSLREHYGADGWSEVTTLLLGLVLNSHRWLRVNVMQLLKILFQQRGPRTVSDNLASEHLMPLLRLLETDLAMEALDVLEEPLTISGGPAAKHVLRMSMHANSLMQPLTVTHVFGVPQESGWCIPNAPALLATCRSNIIAVFDTCSMPSRPSQIQFEPEVEMLSDVPFHTPNRHHPHHHHDRQYLQRPRRVDDDLGGLVHNLHELNSFFQDGRPEPSSSSAGSAGKYSHPQGLTHFTEMSVSTVSTMSTVTAQAPSTRLEARVAAILAKSTADSSMFSDMPSTPFVDVFKVDEMDDSDDEGAANGDERGVGDDGDDEDDDDEDAFVWDSMPVYRTAPNGSSVVYS